MHRVAVIAVPTVTSFELSTPDLIFGQARVGNRPGYEVRMCAAEAGAVAGIGGLAVSVPYGLDAVAGADTVLVIGGAGGEPVGPAVADTVRAAARSGARIGALSCAGAFLLAEAGILDGREATVSAPMADELARRFPAVRVRRDVLYVVDGTVLTCAGHAAAIDLCLHLVRTDHGAAAAGAIARGLAVAPARPADTPQMLDEPVPTGHATSLADTRAWVLGRLDEPLGLADLAGHASTSVRTLTRRFQAETGTSPLRWLLARRLDRARELLETTDLPIESVARRSGLGSADSLRAHLVRELGRTPSAYRADFTRRATVTRRGAAAR